MNVRVCLRARERECKNEHNTCTQLVIIFYFLTLTLTYLIISYFIVLFQTLIDISIAKE